MDEAALWMPGESEEEGRGTAGTETRVVHHDESPDTTGNTDGPSNGYHTQGQEGYEEGEEDDGLMVAQRGEAEGEGHEDPPQSQEMPQEFYSGVDAFLSRPAPSLERVIATPPHTNTHAPRHNAGVARPPSLPTPTPHNTNTNTTHISNKANVRSGSGIDPLLLAEAFAYAQRLQHIMTGQQEGDALCESKNQVGLAGVKQLRKTRSHNQQQMAAMGVGHSSHSSGGSTGTHRRRTSEPTLLTSTGMARVLGPRSKPQAVHKKPNSTKKASTAAKNVHKECEWSLGVGERNADMNTGTIRQHDMQTMVSNFEAKSTIQQLRRELEESQASMHRSEAIIRSVVHDFYGPSASTSTQHPPPFVV